MTRSVDHQDAQRSFVGSAGNSSSVFGSKPQVTARMHLNKNTTLELIDNSSQSMQVRKHLSPFSIKQQRKKFVEERG